MIGISCVNENITIQICNIQVIDMTIMRLKCKQMFKLNIHIIIQFSLQL